MFRKSSRTWPLYTLRWKPLVINIVVKAHHFLKDFLCAFMFSTVSLCFQCPIGWQHRKWAWAERHDVWLAPAELMINESGKRSRGLWENGPARHERCVNKKPKARRELRLSAGAKDEMISCSLKDVVSSRRKINLVCGDHTETDGIHRWRFIFTRWFHIIRVQNKRRFNNARRRIHHADLLLRNRKRADFLHHKFYLLREIIHMYR